MKRLVITLVLFGGLALPSILRSMEDEVKAAAQEYYQNSQALISAAERGDIEEVRRLIPLADINLRDQGYTALVCATHGGNTAMVKLLLESKADATIPDPGGQEPLLVAVGAKKNEMVSALITAKANVDAMPPSGKTRPLIVASQAGQKDLVDMLIAAKADASLQSDNPVKRSPLGVAALNGHIEVVKALLDAKANVLQGDQENNTALHFASYKGREDIARLLVAAHALVDARAKDQATPLHGACHSGSTACARVLLDAEADVNAQDDESATPFLWAVYHKRASVELLQLLLDHNADSNVRASDGMGVLDYAQDRAIRQFLLRQQQVPQSAAEEKHEEELADNSRALIVAVQEGRIEDVRRLIPHALINMREERTALTCAVANGNTAMVNLLLDRKANPGIPNGQGELPLWLAVQKKKSEIASALVRAWVDVDALSKGEESALFLASEDGEAGMVTILINAKADVNLKNSQKLSPLGQATRNGHTEIVKALIHAKANPGLVEVSFAPLHWAVQAEHEDIMRVLLEAKAPVDARSKRQNTPLHFACNQGSAACARILLDARAEVNARSADGTTSLLCAVNRQEESVELVQLLLERKADPQAQFPDGVSALDIAQNEEVRQLLLSHPKEAQNVSEEPNEGKTD